MYLGREVGRAYDEIARMVGSSKDRLAKTVDCETVRPEYAPRVIVARCEGLRGFVVMHMQCAYWAYISA